MTENDAVLLDGFQQDVSAFSSLAQRKEGLIERLPKWLSVIPMIAQWLCLSAYYRSLTLPSAANPAITSGGMVGEGKHEYFAIMGPYARARTAPHASFSNTREVWVAEQEMAQAGLSYPLILKPDIGWCGFGVRLIRNRDDLDAYLTHYPVGERIILQRFVPYDGEAGVFYIRHPGSSVGELLGIVLRYHPRVTGDGLQTVAQLIAADHRLQRLDKNTFHQISVDPEMIPARGEAVRISTIGSTRVGGLYEDASSLATPALLQEIDAIASDMKDLHIARFDLRYENLGAFLAGKGFSIIEVNGAGSEASHAWDPRFTLRQAYSIVFSKQCRLFAIGHAMRRRGHRPIGIWQLACLYTRQQHLIRQYPPSN
jgi:hypothetical protein